MTKDNSTGKNKDFYDKGKAMFDRIQPITQALPQIPQEHSSNEKSNNYLNGYCVGQADLLAEQAKQEPAAWMVYTQDGQSVYVTDNPTDIQEGQRALPFYTTPQWVSLTEWEREAIAVECGAMSADWLVFMEAVEKALKEKNA